MLGSDTAGQVLSDALAYEGVETPQVRIAPTPNASAVVRLGDGERVFESGWAGASEFSLSRVLQGTAHDGASQFKRLGSRGRQDRQARQSGEARRGDRPTVQAQTVPKLLPRLRSFLALDQI
ncbi:hypothetical protein [Streptomyces spiralis]|uniref:hypothetical protein n=1 Tax=Streptomyces spiralis TaxID=66376 RepID=UPI001672161A|nr:hypothetical protein [Streptomyces spiralis]